jgi:hypothetical protein
MIGRLWFARLVLTRVPQIPIYVPAVLITIWFTSMPNCVPPKPKGPSVGPDPMTCVERAAYNKAHPPPRPTPVQKSTREQIRDLLVGPTGADKIVNCLREGAVGDCVMGFGRTGLLEHPYAQYMDK